MDETPRKSYYQISFTGNQALAAVVVLLLALTASFFFGARAGFVRSAEAPASAVGPPESAPAPPAAVPEAPGPASPESRAAPPSSPAPGPAEMPTFEDREAGVPDAGPAPPSSEIGKSSPSRTEIAGSPQARSAPPRSVSAVPPPSPAGKGPVQAGLAEGGRYFVQVLSTPSRLEAERWEKKLLASKYRPAVSVVRTNGRRMFRVRLGPYPDHDRARRAAEKISEEFHRQAWVAPAE